MPTFNDMSPTTGSTLASQITLQESIVNSSTVQATQDGQSATFDLSHAERRLAQLKAEQAIAAGQPKARPRIVSVKFPG